MTHDTSAERGLRISKVRLIRDGGEFEESEFASGMLNILHGVRNSSKSTTLRVVDYCLGDRDNAAKAIGVAVADAYVAVTTELRINGHPYELSRSWSYGRMGKVSINGQDLSVADFSDWILAALGWPNVHIPLGLNPSTAAELPPPCRSAALCATSTATKNRGSASRTRSRSSSGARSSASSSDSPDHVPRRPSPSSSSPRPSAAWTRPRRWTARYSKAPFRQSPRSART
jgi:hypothetical protein